MRAPLPRPDVPVLSQPDAHVLSQCDASVLPQWPEELVFRPTDAPAFPRCDASVLLLSFPNPTFPLFRWKRGLDGPTCRRRRVRLFRTSFFISLCHRQIHLDDLSRAKEIELSLEPSAAKRRTDRYPWTKGNKIACAGYKNTFPRGGGNQERPDTLLGRAFNPDGQRTHFRGPNSCPGNRTLLLCHDESPIN